MFASWPGNVLLIEIEYFISIINGIHNCTRQMFLMKKNETYPTRILSQTAATALHRNCPFAKILPSHWVFLNCCRFALNWHRFWRFWFLFAWNETSQGLHWGYLNRLDDIKDSVGQQCTKKTVSLLLAGLYIHIRVQCYLFLHSSLNASYCFFCQSKLKKALRSKWGRYLIATEAREEG